LSLTDRELYTGCYVDVHCSFVVHLHTFVCYRYSSLSEAEKATAFSLWQKKWNHFIDQSLEMSPSV